MVWGPAMSGRFLPAIVLAILALPGVGAVAAENGPPLRIGHYSTGNGLIGFVLDRLATPVKLRFDGSDEIVALTAEPAPYQSVTFKRDDGIHVLRIYETGRVLLFSDKLSGGSAQVHRDQDAQPLIVKNATKEQAQAEAAAVAQKLKRAGGTALAITLDAPRLGDGSAGWAGMADAATIAGIALSEMLASPIARETIAAKLQRVVIRDTGRVDIKLASRSLIVEIAAKEPIVGRPSSARLKSAIGDLL
jgi:Domain of unknown function (DUF4908)